MAERSAVVTYEFENVSAHTVAAIAARTATAPSAELLARTQDRLAEHAWLCRLGVPTAPGRAVSSAADLDAAVAALGLPGRLKSARGGYDGGGQHRIVDAAAVPAAREIASRGTWLFERDVPFLGEFSILVARDAEGSVRAYPPFQNVHRDGILAETTWPASTDARVATAARDAAIALAEDVRLVGLMAVECFDLGSSFAVNELAPRVHNSGHLTLEACAVSQFGQHLRAICGLGLAEAGARVPAAAMVNLLGDRDARRVELRGLPAAMAVEGATVHVYGKSSVRARRKMGHVTAVGTTVADALRRARAARAALSFAEDP